MSDSDEVKRQRKAVQLRMAGYTFAEIANSEGIGSEKLFDTPGAAYDAVHTGLALSGQGDSQQEQRRLDMERYDALQRAMWRKALTGDTGAAKFVLNVMRDRGKLLGLSNLPAQDSVGDPLDELAARRDRRSS